MEYVIGAVVSGLLITLAYFIFNKTIIQHRPIKIKISQSRTYSMISQGMLNVPKKVRLTQSLRHLQANHIRVLMTNSHAYWIKDNSVYRADIKNGVVVEESAKPLDIMGMDRVQLDEMMFIVEKLTEGTSNDYWGSGNSKL